MRLITEGEIILCSLFRLNNAGGFYHRFLQCFKLRNMIVLHLKKDYGISQDMKV